MIMVYEAREDSYLLCRNVPVYAKGRVLDMGTGSGILAAEASKHANKVIGADIDAQAVDYCKNKYNIDNLYFLQSDLFENIEGKFDLILFNAPYLPSDPRAPDIALDGGKRGYEVIQRFLGQAKGFLKTEGIILLLFSSLTKKGKVDELLKGEYAFEMIDTQKLDFEELYVYKIQPN